MGDRTKVKICGIANLGDARFSAGAMADYLGFIFYEKSPRYVSPAEAGAMINWIEGPEKVGVFVNQPLDDVNQIAKGSGLDLVQLHGSESLEYCELVEKPIIKVIHITPDYDLEELKAQVELYSEVSEFLLFDSKIDGQWGGTGKTFDWNILKDITGDKPFFLSGGLNPENVKEAVETVHPYAIDVSSGLEEKPGLKDFEKIENLMEVMNSIEY
ncbi:MAG: phosphoribosylanthranilate isomerase [Balneolaceae bacterium]